MDILDVESIPEFIGINDNKTVARRGSIFIMALCFSSNNKILD